MAFGDRLKRSVEFEKSLFGLLKLDPNIVSICVNGTEHTHPAFVSLLRKNKHPGSVFIRYMPDGVLLHKDGSVAFFDAKAAKTIEKAAYDNYMLLSKAVCPVLIFILSPWDGAIYRQEVSKLELFDGSISLNNVPEHMRYPVKDGWIYPPGPVWNEIMETTSGSGTPYRHINFGSLIRYTPKADDDNMTDADIDSELIDKHVNAL